ncbi:MAG TPA: cytochrome c [Steroidobacteraceae bacterium]|nr:cytochrome c [Steroidobacteraceae bacterium]
MSNPTFRTRIRSGSHRRTLQLLSLGLALIAGSALRTAAIAQTAGHSAVFDANCSMCHQLGAAGVPGQFPRLAGRAGKIAATAAGRNYLERVVLSGMIGSITVDDAPIVGGMMPSFASLPDKDLADVLDYITSLDDSGKLQWKGAAFTPADIAKARADKPLSPAQVHQLRATVVSGTR